MDTIDRFGLSNLVERLSGDWGGRVKGQNEVRRKGGGAQRSGIPKEPTRTTKPCLGSDSFVSFPCLFLPCVSFCFSIVIILILYDFACMFNWF